MGDTRPSAAVQVDTFEDAYSAAKGSHALCILTEWDEFRDLDYKVDMPSFPAAFPPHITFHLAWSRRCCVASLGHTT